MKIGVITDCFKLPMADGIKLAAELGGVLHAVGAAVGMVEDDVIDGVGAALEGQKAAAAADEGVDVRKGNIVT